MSEAKVWPASIYTTLSRDWPITFEAAKDWNPSSTVGSITYHWSTTVSPWWDGGVF